MLGAAAEFNPLGHLFRMKRVIFCLILFWMKPILICEAAEKSGESLRPFLDPTISITEVENYSLGFSADHVFVYTSPHNERLFVGVINLSDGKTIEEIYLDRQGYEEGLLKVISKYRLKPALNHRLYAPPIRIHKKWCGVFPRQLENPKPECESYSGEGPKDIIIHCKQKAAIWVYPPAPPIYTIGELEFDERKGTQLEDNVKIIGYSEGLNDQVAIFVEGSNLGMEDWFHPTFIFGAEDKKEFKPGGPTNQ